MEKRKEKRPLPLYTYKGVTGVILANHFVTEQSARHLELTAEDCELSYDDAYTGGYGGEADIVEDYVVNIENNKRIVLAWVSTIYLADDYIERMYLVTTGRYYNWTSEATECLVEIRNKTKDLESYLGDLKDLNKVLFSIIDEIQEIIDSYFKKASKDVKKYNPVNHSLTEIKEFLSKQEEYQDYEDLKKTILNITGEVVRT